MIWITGNLLAVGFFQLSYEQGDTADHSSRAKQNFFFFFLFQNFLSLRSAMSLMSLSWADGFTAIARGYGIVLQRNGKVEQFALLSGLHGNKVVVLR